MPFTPETGAGLPNATSLASVEAADDRAEALGMADADWLDLDEEVKEQRLFKATNYMTGAYRTRWKGTRLLRTQALDWPRYGAEADGYCVESNIVPAEVVAACIDLAFNPAIDALAPDQTRGIVREKVGPLETEYDRYAPQATQYRAIDMMLAPFLKGSSAMASLVRA